MDILNMINLPVNLYYIKRDFFTMVYYSQMKIQKKLIIYKHCIKLKQLFLLPFLKDSYNKIKLLKGFFTLKDFNF